MTDDSIPYRQLEFMASRIPATDALAVFIPTGVEPDAELKKVIGRTGFSRWYPVEGGQWMRTPYEGGEYDSLRFTLLKDGWDHEHCTRCSARIEPMTLCWVTRTGRFILLDEKCHAEVFDPPSLTR